MIAIACPRLEIEPCEPAQFAERMNALTEFPKRDPNRTVDQERVDLTILSCMVALGGGASCSITSDGRMRMRSERGSLILGCVAGKISVEEGGEVPTEGEQSIA